MTARPASVSTVANVPDVVRLKIECSSCGHAWTDEMKSVTPSKAPTTD